MKQNGKEMTFSVFINPASMMKLRCRQATTINNLYNRAVL